MHEKGAHGQIPVVGGALTEVGTDVDLEIR
jgi:hypothetical protein